MGARKISYFTRQRYLGDDILFAGNGGSTNRRDGKDLFVIAAEIPDSATQLATSKRVLMLLG